MSARSTCCRSCSAALESRRPATCHELDDLLLFGVRELRAVASHAVDRDLPCGRIVLRRLDAVERVAPCATGADVGGCTRPEEDAPVTTAEGIVSTVPPATLAWLLEPENPAVAVLTRRALLDEHDSPETVDLWAHRKDYEPVRRILGAIRDDGSWDVPSRDYQKYGGSLWQIIFLGELYASGECHRVQRGAAYAFSRQLPDGSWSASSMRPAGCIPCLTANVGRGLARLGFEGIVDCDQSRGWSLQLNGYCHMLTPKLLLLLSEVPQDLWPDGAQGLRDECVAKLREKEVFRCLPAEAREFTDAVWSLPSSERSAFRDRFVAEHPDLHYGDKPGWLRFGFPLSYNSDALEALLALATVGEARRPKYEPAIALVRAAADPQMRWTMRNSLNGKMIADIEAKGAPSKWLTLRALRALSHFEA
jgi:hypothetical protein